MVQRKANIQPKDAVATKSIDKTTQPPPPPILRSGKCSRCSMSDRVNEEIIECFVCLNLFHALCRDVRGNFDSASITTKSFYDNFVLISNHIKPHQSRWGFFKFVCSSCSAKNVKSKRSAIRQNSAKVKHCEAQTFESGTIDINCLDSSNDIIDIDDSHLSTLLQSIDDVKQQNETILKTINRSESFVRQIDDKVYDISSSIQSLKTLQTSLSDSVSPQPQLDVDKIAQSISDKINVPPSGNQTVDPIINAEQIPKPYNQIDNGFLSESEYNALLNLLQNSDKFQQLKSKNSEREVQYFGEFDYRYGNIKHNASEFPPVINTIIEKISEKYPNATINSCLVTKYKNGKDSCPSHHDNEPFIGADSDIFTLSIGCKRQMLFKCSKNSSTDCIDLLSNSLLKFSRYSQEFWAHEIPSDESKSVRFSLTFRDIAPMNANSTLVIGDSNTSQLKFGVGRNTFGKWMPGLRIKAGRIRDIPNPSEIKSVYKNIIFHTGINDIRATNADPIPVLTSELQKRCISYSKKFPYTKLHISLALPTKDPNLNALVNHFNYNLIQFSHSNTNISIIEHTNLMQPSGTLHSAFGRHTQDGNPKSADIVHLGNKGISVFSMNLKKCIVRMANSRESSHKRSGQQFVPPRLKKANSLWSNDSVYNYPIAQQTMNNLTFNDMYMNGKSFHEMNPPFHPHLPPKPPFQAQLPPWHPLNPYPARTISLEAPSSIPQSINTALNAPIPGPPPPLPSLPPLPTKVS